MLPLPDFARRGLAKRGRGLRLVVLRLGAFGDVLRTLPAVRLIKRGLPEAEIRWVVEDRWAVALREHPDLEEVIEVPRRSMSRKLKLPWRWPRLTGEWTALRARLRASDPQIAIDFHGNLRSGLLARATTAPLRIGYDGHQQKEGNRWFSTHRVPSGSRRSSRIERNLDMVRALGLPVTPFPESELPLARGAETLRAGLLRSMEVTGGYAVIAPSVSKAQSHKKPDPRWLGRAAQAAARRGLRSIVAWGPGERDDATAVVGAAPDAILAPPTDLRELTALLAGARLFVGGDTGPLHLACSTGCPVVGIYGPTDPEVNRPWGVPHRVVAPPGRSYTGIRREDRRLGFAGFDPEGIERAIEDLLDDGLAAATTPGEGVQREGEPPQAAETAEPASKDEVT